MIKIKFFEISDIRNNSVNITGAVIRPGPYALGDGLDVKTTYGQGINFYFPWNKSLLSP